jgi:hypothetical protein
MEETLAVVIDACVLVNFSVCDTLLRLAEPPRLYEPVWSDDIMRETTRTLGNKVGWPSTLINHFESELRANFPEAWIEGYEPFIPFMNNDEKDRHVAAAATHAGASIILTFNLRHFQPEHLDPFGIRAFHPQVFLIQLFRRDQALVLAKLRQQAADRNRTLPQLLGLLAKTVPDFTAVLSTP